MEEEEGNGGAKPPMEPRREELLAAAVSEGDTPAAAVSINIEGSRENFLQPAPPSGAPADSVIVSSAGGAAIVVSFNGLTSHSIMGLTSVGAAAAAAASALNTAAGGGAARGGRGAQLQLKGKHSGNEFRLDPGQCHHLSNPDVLIAYNK